MQSFVSAYLKVTAMSDVLQDCTDLMKKSMKGIINARILAVTS